MTYVLAFDEVQPSPRDDGAHWVSVLIEEAAAAAGSWTLIDTIALSPLDTNTEAPMVRSFTTRNATLTDGWYRLTFVDETGGRQQTIPEHHDTGPSTAYATVRDVKGRAGPLRDAWGPRTDPNEEDLQRFLNTTAAEIDALIGGQGFAVPVTDPVAAGALTSWNTDLALAIALVATWPGGTGPESVGEALKAVQARLAAYTAAVNKGSLPALIYLRAQEAQGAAGSANFWTAELDYSPWLDDLQSGGIVDYGGGILLRGPVGPEFHKSYTRF